MAELICQLQLWLEATGTPHWWGGYYLGGNGWEVHPDTGDLVVTVRTKSGSKYCRKYYRCQDLASLVSAIQEALHD